MKYYTYRHIREDNYEVFYVGIGTKPKLYNTTKSEYHRAYKKANRSQFWKNIVAKTKYYVEIVFESDIYSEVQDKEKELILQYGRRTLETGTLCNIADGGEGNHQEDLKYLSKQVIRLSDNKIFESAKSVALEDNITYGKLIFNLKHKTNCGYKYLGDPIPLGPIKSLHKFIWYCKPKKKFICDYCSNKEGIHRIRVGWFKTIEEAIIARDKFLIERNGTDTLI